MAMSHGFLNDNDQKVLEMVLFFETKVIEHTWKDRIILYKLIL